MRHRLLLIPAALAMLGSGPLAPVIQVVDDYALLQGTWKLVYREYNGQSHEVTAATWWTFQQNYVAMTSLGSAPNRKVTVTECEFQLDPTKHPAWLTRHDRLRDALMIYCVQGDTLQICTGLDRRPVQFGTNGASTILFIFKRVPRTPPARPLGSVGP